MILVSEMCHNPLAVNTEIHGVIYRMFSWKAADWRVPVPLQYTVCNFHWTSFDSRCYQQSPCAATELAINIWLRSQSWYCRNIHCLYPLFEQAVWRTLQLLNYLYQEQHDTTQEQHDTTQEQHDTTQYVPVYVIAYLQSRDDKENYKNMNDIL